MPVKKVTRSVIPSEQSSRLRTKSRNLSRMRVKKDTETSSEILRSAQDDKPKRGSLSVPVYSLAGRASGTLSLPKEVFGAKVNKKLLAQAVRVYMTNQKTLPGNTKTRGQVEGSSVKIYRQKGTGRARHGSIRASIFVGGGIVFGPKMRKVRLDLPQKMKKAALKSALSSKVKDQGILGVSGIDKASGKTKEIAKLVNSLWLIVNSKDKKTINHKPSTINTLIVTGEKVDNVARAVRNIPDVNVLPANLINAYEILRHDLLLVTKEAVEKLGVTRPSSGGKK